MDSPKSPSLPEFYTLNILEMDIREYPDFPKLSKYCNPNPEFGEILLNMIVIQDPKKQKKRKILKNKRIMIKSRKLS